MTEANSHFDQPRPEIAIEIARELADEFGADLAGETKKQLAPGEQGARAFGVSPSDAAVAAGLLIGCVQLAMQYYSDKKMDGLMARLEADAPKPGKVSPAKRSSIIAKVVERFSRAAGHKE